MDNLFALDWASSLLLVAQEAAAEGAAEEGGLFAFDLTLPLQIVQFLLLMFLLNAFFYRPISKVIEERAEYIRSKATSAQGRLDEAKDLARRYEDELRATRLRAQQVIAEAEAEAQRIRAQKLAEAQAEANARLEATRLDLEREKQAALASLGSEIDQLSRQLADKLLGAARGGGY